MPEGNGHASAPADEGYKAMLLRAEAMMGQAGLAAYDRAVILCGVFSDPEFRADNAALDDYGLSTILTKYCGDLCVKFLRLKQLLDWYPVRQQWATGNLEKMLADMLAEQEARNKADAPPSQTRQRATLAQLQEARERAAYSSSQLRQTADRLSTSEAEIRRLQIENRELREQLVAARRRIRELEGMLPGGPQLAA